MNKAVGIIVVILLLVGASFQGLGATAALDSVALLEESRALLEESRETVLWEYKVVRMMTEGNERQGIQAVKYSSIQLDEAQIERMGAEGWELTGIYVENETAFPNFGKEEYVTGIRVNVRPQMAVLLFKRPKSKPAAAPEPSST
ncbi:MAG: DUF4177 domain-containing protein [Myxococcota bacterium]|jgi:hypothetical protein|nr:DUF4177 domain-containing protein [Myxococcota bacterium]